MEDEPRSRGTILIGFHDAALELWGRDGVAAIAARLPPDVRADTIATVLRSSEWFPTRHVVAWHDAVFSGPAQSNETTYRAFVDRSMDLGFWRVQRLLLKIATPAILIERSAKLWRHLHTHGTLAIDATSEPHTAKVTLRDHPFVNFPCSRMSFAEGLRYVVSMARANNVRETHAQGAGTTMNLRVTWE